MEVVLPYLGPTTVYASTPPLIFLMPKAQLRRTLIGVKFDAIDAISPPSGWRKLMYNCFLYGEGVSGELTRIVKINSIIRFAKTNSP